jgi:signal transduction histidine kinase
VSAETLPQVQPPAARFDWARLVRWAVPLSLLALLVGLGLGSWLLHWPLPGNRFMLTVCALWVGFGVTRALYTDALLQESQKRQRLIEQLDSTRRDLAEEERRAGVLMERHRLARDLHDTLAQSFTGIVLHLEAAEQALPPQAPTAQLHIDQARASARASLQEVRRLLWALRPGLLEHSSLSAVVRELVQKWNDEQAASGRTAVLELGTLGRLHPEVEVTILRAVQEALANVHKHSQARTVHIVLQRSEERVALTVTDDGIGFPGGAPPAPASPGGYGLVAMRERVAQLAGELRFAPGPHGGAEVALWLPVRGEVGL